VECGSQEENPPLFPSVGTVQFCVFRTMLRTSKRKRTEQQHNSPSSPSKHPPTKTTKKKQELQYQPRKEIEYLRGVLVNANETPNPLALLPSYENLIHIPLLNERSKCMPSNSPDAATVHHFASPLPSNILLQCIDIFKSNMSNMYQNSSWGLDIQQKINELKHPDAKFLIVLSSSSITNINVNISDPTDTKCAYADTKSNRQHDDDDADDSAVIIENDGGKTNRECTTQVLGFVHFRYECNNNNDDNDNINDDNNDPITYLYEIQIHPTVQKFGIGNKLLTILELLSQKLRLKKIILTVFKSNMSAMTFYIKRNYVVDESSPSNFTTQSSSSSLSSSSSSSLDNNNNNEQCADYEILSKIIE